MVKFCVSDKWQVHPPGHEGKLLRLATNVAGCSWKSLSLQLRWEVHFHWIPILSQHWGLDLGLWGRVTPLPREYRYHRLNLGIELAGSVMGHWIR